MNTDEAGGPTHLDLSGLKCPLPTLRTRKALRLLPPGGVLTVICTDPMAAIDIPNLVREAGDALLSQERSATHLSFTIRKAVAEIPQVPPH
ncbi:sulfurtransferase TusA family protein [Methylobacterium sp. J-068]|uniref:sulfurtransferase TusA family protein n=1 Tax=Methylobacterium sp. J-068 TaxID=2836649 RepID=UPI001FBB4B28|nr:sulfurtransferase TusA family protein [Methylobacterium sp. J-068]MCJ2033895.1 sulfurtransferase TusA family protein [Methylobacterium sp. J-068]